jgi:sulfur carrier protein
MLGQDGAHRDAMIRVRVNGAETEVHEGATVRTLLEALGVSFQAVAVAVNRAVVPRSRHQERVLVTGDEVEIVRAVGGG